ncbi:hypothetical protein VOLCADRAFT_98666 [Volvox carteri f. nagariensis]|uniref:Uncharacterized protein n=1 Tax=Volvox carteri f. nagariensis TaxID=3068 RepID=D8UFZ0_VOLCA|nr:uncharacterized protein VOLCADRAFT_98666 [Volvox carteri f. nagariensis]EFJ41337.1 hypothetical protein VOLCADRAFT_98666 [Volvox carteri f. nagariensis]|eukprot:XP_002957567.1 hypothetical protein VOLCADRAFT_98666 [Volvox carteri f. nagariensis]
MPFILITGVWLLSLSSLASGSHPKISSCGAVPVEAAASGAANTGSPASSPAPPSTTPPSPAPPSPAPFPLISPSASAFEKDTAKLAVLIAAAVSPKLGQGPPRKDPHLPPSPSAASSRRLGFAQQAPRRRGAPASSSSSSSKTSSPSPSPRPSISSSSSNSNISVGSMEAAPFDDQAGERPSYMRGTAASRAKASSTREPSRLGCSSAKLSSSSGAGTGPGGRALMSGAYRRSAQY